ncbi:hypothetical protein F2P81_019607 [Scophthalmus maximus]|uniref:Uncharacterized protein n=1 Tax=Scophthalmus maximus TaxID=52904 RepID=A0A6A4SA44_SCOMX|nr:hypothetical protein F2P81_019607 [Scophthalmus maximus]
MNDEDAQRFGGKTLDPWNHSVFWQREKRDLCDGAVHVLSVGRTTWIPFQRPHALNIPRHRKSREKKGPLSNYRELRRRNIHKAKRTKGNLEKPIRGVSNHADRFEECDTTTDGFLENTIPT